MEQQIDLPALSMPAFPSVNFSFVSHAWVLGIIFAVFLICYAVVSGVLSYHWSAYGMKNVSITIAETLFFFVSIVLFGVAGLAIHYF